MELQQDHNGTQNTAPSIRMNENQDRHQAIEESINRISQQFWQELNESNAADPHLWGMWK
jgi:hypothetical protein